MSTNTLDDLIGSDVIDSRDLDDLLEELANTDELTEDEQADLATLNDIKDEVGDDWKWGVAFINEDYFVEYVQELASDIGDINEDSWLTAYIDWDLAAEAVKNDYTYITIGGYDYLWRP